MYSTILRSFLISGSLLSFLTSAQPTVDTSNKEHPPTTHLNTLDGPNVHRVDKPILTPRGNKVPHTFHKINLDDFEAEQANFTDRVIKRTNVDTCSYLQTTDNDYRTCTRFSEFNMEATVRAIANQFWVMSHNNDCSHYTGYGSEDSSLPPRGWEIWASNKDPYNGDCSTTADEYTIAGSLQKWFRAHSMDLCQVTCLQLSHAGTWEGFITLSPDIHRYPTQIFDCSAQSATTCENGGKDDCQGEGCVVKPAGY